MSAKTETMLVSLAATHRIVAASDRVVPFFDETEPDLTRIPAPLMKLARSGHRVVPVGDAIYPDDHVSAFRHYEDALRPFVEQVQERAAAKACRPCVRQTRSNGPTAISPKAT